MSASTITVKLTLPRSLHRRGKAHADRLGLTLGQYYLEGARNYVDCLDEMVLEEERAAQAEVVPEPEVPTEVVTALSLEERVQRLESAVFPTPAVEVVPLSELSTEAREQLDAWEINGAEPVAPPDQVQVQGLDADYQHEVKAS